MRQLFVALVLLTAFSAAASAAVVEGTLYDYAFSPVAGVVEVNSTPVQKVVAANGSYRFEVGPGTYLLSATSRENASASQALVVERAGTYRLDMVLIDELGLGQAANASLGELSGGGLPDLGEGVDGGSAFSVPLALLGVALAAIVLGAYYRLRGRKKHPPQPADAKATEPGGALELEEERDVLNALDASSGLITQKDLRKALPHWSEARVSLVLTSLEAAGKLKKIKKGRGNIIRKA
jgi:uncharacterized membrane protein